MANNNRFQIVKSVGSPSVSGAERVETLADHTNNPGAHPDYQKKGATPAVFSGGDHLTDRLSHAIYFARRGELCLTKLDYEQSKTISYANNQNNYMATSGVKRHIVTTYVLAQVLSSLGLDGTKKYIETSKIVGTTSTPPAAGLDTYVPSYGMHKKVKDQVDYWLGDKGIDATYLKKTDAASTYLTKEAAGTLPEVGTLTDEIDTVKAQIGQIGFTQCEAGEISIEGIKYYKYNIEKGVYKRVAMSPGVALTTQYYKRNTEDTVKARIDDAYTKTEEYAVDLTTVDANGYVKVATKVLPYEGKMQAYDVIMRGEAVIEGSEKKIVYEMVNPLAEIAYGSTDPATIFVSSANLIVTNVVRDEDGEYSATDILLKKPNSWVNIYGMMPTNTSDTSTKTTYSLDDLTTTVTVRRRQVSTVD